MELCRTLKRESSDADAAVAAVTAVVGRWRGLPKWGLPGLQTGLKPGRTRSLGLFPETH